MRHRIPEYEIGWLCPPHRRQRDRWQRTSRTIDTTGRALVALAVIAAACGLAAHLGLLRWDPLACGAAGVALLVIERVSVLVWPTVQDRWVGVYRRARHCPDCAARRVQTGGGDV